MVVDSSAVVAILFNEPERDAFSTSHATLYERYGKGRHPAGLNLGDCCAYALARHTGEPLRFKGDDFSHTDVVPAL